MLESYSSSFSFLSRFDSKQDFYRKIGIYLREITGNSCNFSIKDISNEFIVLRLYYPTKYTKGIKISSLLDFFGLDDGGGGKYEPERSEGEYGAERSSATPVVLGGGGG